MAFDLGLEQESFSNEEEIAKFIENISKSFELVLIAEYFDESLVLMKRMLCWDSEDIIYVKHKMRSSLFRNNITERHKVQRVFFLGFSRSRMYTDISLILSHEVIEFMASRSR